MPAPATASTSVSVSTFHGWLAQQLSQIDPSTVDPGMSKMEEDDVVIGQIVSDYVKSLCGLRSKLCRQVRDLERKALHAMIDGAEVERSKGHDPLTCPNCKLGDEMFVMQDRLRTVEAIMWSEVRACLDAKGRNTYVKLGAIGICQDWSVVACRSQNSGSRVQVIDLSQLGDMFGIPRAAPKGWGPNG